MQHNPRLSWVDERVTLSYDRRRRLWAILILPFYDDAWKVNNICRTATGPRANAWSIMTAITKNSKLLDAIRLHLQFRFGSEGEIGERRAPWIRNLFRLYDVQVQVEVWAYWTNISAHRNTCTGTFAEYRLTWATPLCHWRFQICACWTTRSGVKLNSLYVGQWNILITWFYYDILKFIVVVSDMLE